MSVEKFRKRLKQLTAVEARKIIEHLCLEESGEVLVNVAMQSTASFLDLARESQLIRPEPVSEEIEEVEVILPETREDIEEPITTEIEEE